MVSVEEAWQIVESVTIKPEIFQSELEKSVGLVLAEEVFADRDFPPFNRVAMDGIAIHSSGYKNDHEFFIENVQAAGSPQQILSDIHNCIEVMTGAILPEGTDTVIRYEDLVISDGKARIKPDSISPGMSIHTQGSDAKKDDSMLQPGQKISAAEVALLASLGKAKVAVYSYPKTAILSSGDELVDISVQPEPHQIRQSNVYALQAAMRELGWDADRFHLIDDRDFIRQHLRNILHEYDVIILSGGVSKGKFDFIPETLTDLGVQKLFHQVSQRPGKPFWFGCTENKKVVFALPGNPVSTYMCFYRYIKPWMLSQLGFVQPTVKAILAQDFDFKPPLTYYLQVSLRNENGMLLAYPVAGGGSGDFVNLKKVDGFLELPKDESAFKAGSVYPVLLFRSDFLSP
jgi:molybdopterin molybdotransferase